MQNLLDGFTKVLIDPWNNKFSMPEKCGATVVSIAFLASLGVAHLASAGWRYYRSTYHKIDEPNDTHQKIKWVAHSIFPFLKETVTSKVDDIKNQELKTATFQVTDIKNQELVSKLSKQGSELPLYPTIINQKDPLPDSDSLTNPITIIQQKSEDGTIDNFIALKTTCKNRDEDGANLPDETITIYIKDDKDKLLIRLDKEDDFKVPENVVQNALINNILDGKQLANVRVLNNHVLALRLTQHNITRLPLHHLSKTDRLPTSEELKDPITLVVQQGEGNKVNSFIAFKLVAKREGMPDQNKFQVFYLKDDQNQLFSWGSDSDFKELKNGSKEELMLRDILEDRPYLTGTSKAVKNIVLFGREKDIPKVEFEKKIE